MSLLIQEETKYYSAIEIENVIRKIMVMQSEGIVDPNTGFKMNIADDGRIMNQFITEFFALLKINEKGKEKTVKIRMEKSTIAECN